MGNHPALAAEERSESRNKLRRLPDSLVSANMFGDDRPTLSLEVERASLQMLIGQGAENAVVLLSVGSEPAVKALIRHVQYNRVTGRITHLDFYVFGETDQNAWT